MPRSPTDATYEDVAAAAGDAIREAELAIIRTPPRTLAGAVGVLQFVRSDLGAGREGICDGDEDWADLCFRSRPRSPPRRVRRPRSPRTSDNRKENDQVAQCSHWDLRWSMAHATQCVPRDNTARILVKPSPNDADPFWKGGYIGTSWTFDVTGIVKSESLTFAHRGRWCGPECPPLERPAVTKAAFSFCAKLD
jgi:hypothetical protein